MALAKRFYSMITKINITITMVLAIIVFFCRRQIVGFYTDDPDVQEIAIPVLMLLALNFIPDGMQGYLQGPIRSMGLQKIASYYAISCYWVLGLPGACLFGLYFKFGVMGLEMGIGLAVTVQCICYALILHKTDWQKVADEAVERMEKDDAEHQKQKKESLSEDNFSKVV